MSESAPYVGLMSGTSADGLDAVLVRFDGDKPEMLATSCTSFDDQMRADMALLRSPGSDEISRYGQLDRSLAALCARAVEELIGSEKPRAIGWAGHTVRHCPDGPLPFSLQAGDPARIAHLTGVPVVAQFRRSDMAAGGQGAPLAPLFHSAFFADDARVCAVANLGGIANLSLLRPGGRVEGFDTGPGNCLMDEWAQRHLGVPFDRDGDWAGGGQIVDTLLRRMLQTQWLQLPPPKSTGREQFHLDWLQEMLQPLTSGGQAAGMPAPQDIQATLAAFSARALADALLAQAPDCSVLLLCGGGALNQHLVGLIRHYLPDIQVESTAAAGLDPQWVEAAGLAWLARQRICGKELDLVDITGGSCRHPGTIFLPDSG